MKLLYKKVLDNLRRTSYFNDNIYLEECGPSIVDKLVETRIFDIAETEDIEQHSSNKDRLNCIINILIVKKDDIYETFKKCLEENNKHVVEKMWRMEIELQKSCEDCIEYIQHRLQASYVEKPGSSVGFDEIQNTIIHYIRKCTEHHDTLLGVLDEDLMTDCIKRAFPKSEKKNEIVLNKTKCGKKNKSPRNAPTTKTIYGIDRKIVEKQKGNCSLEISSSGSEDEPDTVLDVATTTDANRAYYNVEEFADLVIEILEKNVKDWDVNIPLKIKEQQIDSEVYEKMSDEDTKILFPRIGDKIKIKTEYDKIKSGSSTIGKQQPIYDRLRRFDRPASEGTKYKCGSFVRCMSRRPGNLITPVHKFFMFEKSSKRNDDKENLNNLLLEIISFAAACMNDRTNGTFHAGILESIDRPGLKEIVGCNIDISNMDIKITNAIRGYFKEYQVGAALKCIRPPQFIEVIGKTPEILHVIEVDVVPFSRIVENQTFSVKGNTKGNYLFYRFQGEVKQQDSSEMEEYMQKEKHLLIDQRLNSEQNRRKGRNENLNNRLKDFLCGGENEFDESLYPVLVLSHLHKVNEHKFTDSEFLKDIPWRSIFDFNQRKDENGFQVALEKKYAKCFLTYNVEDFNPRKREEKIIKQTHENVTESTLPTWIYCNGSTENEHEIDARTWIHNKIESFRKVLEFYSSIYSDSRSRIIIPLFEKENLILTEAIVEILLLFGKQCVVLCPNRSIASMCYDELSRRPNAFPPDCSIDDCFLIGLPWEQVNQCIRSILKSPKRYEGIQIPRSNGVPYTIDEKVVNELSDLDLVGINQCKNVEELTTDQKLMKEQEVREEYYQGGAIQWENFYFKGQVLVRDVHKDLETHVRRALDEYDNEGLAVEKVAVYHQPGSGGSTSSRQILWDLKANYRCCVVKKITNQTCDQIGRFRKLGENDDEDNDIKPILVLLDNNNEEAITQFVDDLEDESTKHSCDLFCVLLICFRVSALPLDRPSKCVMLRQELSAGENGEHNWFKEKYKKLLERYKEKKGCDPHTLLAFNIMKENFNRESIRKSVRDFVGDRLITAKQMILLKYLAFFNAFDLHFQSIPISCFDPIMKPEMNWIKHLPPPLKVLTNRCRKPGYGGNNSAIRMSNYLLSRPVLDAILENERHHGAFQNTIGEVALEVMCSECFGSFYKYENKLLRNILGDIMKKRDRCSLNQRDKGKMEKFSPLVLELLKQEDSDHAVRIMNMAYEITDDPLVAQQLARVYADLGNWDAANKTICKAIEQKPNNSYLVHTKGQLLKDQLQHRFSSYIKDGSQFPKAHVNEAISLTQEAMQCFRQCQKLSESQDVSQQNPAGYESEILMAIDLIRLIGKCPELKSFSVVFQRGDPKEAIMYTLNNKFLKTLPEMINVTVEKLERIIHGINRHLFHSHSRSMYTVDTKQLDKHKKELAAYFSQDNTPMSVNVDEKLERANVYSFISAYRFGDFQLLLKNLQAMNRNSNELRHHNLRIYLAMSCSVALTNPYSLFIEPSQLLSLSRKYYDTSSSSKSELAILESYLYFITFHWPLPTRKNLEDKISPYSAWSKALSAWLDLDSKKSLNKRRSDKIFFYLGKSEKYPGFVKIDKQSSLPQVATFTGIVNDCGTDITITVHSFQSEKGHDLKIPFYRRLGRALHYNRIIEVIIGFGLQGPRADWLEKPSSFQKPRKLTTKTDESHKHFKKSQRHVKSALPERSTTMHGISQTLPITTSQNMWNNPRSNSHTSRHTFNQPLLTDQHLPEYSMRTMGLSKHKDGNSYKKPPNYQDVQYPHNLLSTNRHTNQAGFGVNHHPCFSLHKQLSQNFARITSNEDQSLYCHQPPPFPRPYSSPISNTVQPYNQDQTVNRTRQYSQQVMNVCPGYIGSLPVRFRSSVRQQNKFQYDNSADMFFPEFRQEQRKN